VRTKIKVRLNWSWRTWYSFLWKNSTLWHLCITLFLSQVTAGPTLGTFGAIGVRGFEMWNNMKLSPLELLNAETPTRLDLAPRILWMGIFYSPLHTMGTIYCVNFGANSLFAIYCQPLIFSYGWIQIVDTIILPARLILSPKRTFSVRCAWALLVQPADLDIPMPKTRIVANTCNKDSRWKKYEFPLYQPVVAMFKL
jgi:hypothetical protein